MKQILLTGGNGYIGHYVAERILHDHRDTVVHFWIHAQNESEFSEKSEQVRATFPSYQERLIFSWGELKDADPFSRVDFSTVTSIIHNAAITNFNVKEEDANLVNRDGSIKLLEKARSLTKLEKFTYVSTVYASGLKPGEVPETFLTNEHGFSNQYERSKWEVEEYIRNHCQELPWEISRVATVICHDESGQVIQHNAVHNTLKLLYYGLISLMPGLANTPVYLVTGEEVANSLAHLHLNAPVHQIFNITHTQAHSLTLGKLVDHGFTMFCEDPAFKARRILKPLFTDEKSFQSLVESAKGFGGQVLAQAVTSIAPFGKQLFITKAMENHNLKKHYAGFTDHRPEDIIQRTCADLIKKQFKKG